MTYLRDSIYVYEQTWYIGDNTYIKATILLKKDQKSEEYLNRRKSVGAVWSLFVVILSSLLRLDMKVILKNYFEYEYRP